jgi:hypothetical protein
MSTTELQLFKTSGIQDERFNQALNAIFPSNAEGQKLASARAILELSADAYSDEKLRTLLADFEFIANIWLDEFERKQFNGKSLSELLKK